jgi:phage terminase large subunit-like protein
MSKKTAAKWIRGPVDELAIEEGCHFDPASGERVTKFLEIGCRQSKGEWAGKPLELIPWQRDFIMRLYGWRRADGTRRYRTFYLEIPKKNGKSTLLSGLALYHLIADDEPGAEVYTNAYDLSQARIIFDESANMVRSSPQLTKRLEVIPSAKRIIYPEKASKFQALSADVPSKDGVSASFTIFDELHRQRTPAMWDIFEFAGAARRQPLLGAITTAGYDRNSICYRQHEYTKKVNAGLVPDTAHLGVIYGADQAEDWSDPEVWKRVNPSMGYTLKLEDFEREVAKAKESPEKLNNFLRLRLNIWTNAAERFLSREKWDACGVAIVDHESFEGAICYGGLDLASTTDIAALVLVFPDIDGNYEVLCRFWAPEEGAAKREEKDKVPYLTWARQGFLTLTPGDVIDYDYIRSEINDLAGKYDLRKLFADPYNATQLGVQLQGDGIPIEMIRQGFLSLSPPTKELERLVIGKRLKHGNNPVLNTHADNAVAVKDQAGNIKLSREKSTEKIDGMAALVNAIAAATSETESVVTEAVMFFTPDRN